MKVVILAGGEGTRLRPLTCNIPKPLVPILNRPYLEHLLDQLKRSDISEAILTLSYLPNKIQDHFGDGHAHGVSLGYALEASPLGTAGALKNVEKRLTDTFMVFNGDIYTDLDLKAVVEFHKAHGAKATIVLAPVEDPTPYGLVETAPDGRVLRFLEKPRPDEVSTVWINAGTYVLEPEVLRYAPQGEAHSIERQLFPRLLEEGLPVYALRSRAYWIDIGNLQNYLRVHKELLLGSALAEFDERMVSPGVWVGDGCRIDPSAQVRGPVLLGPDCSIGPGACLLGPMVLGRGSSVERGCTLEGSILWDGAQIGEGAFLEGCVLGSNVRVAGGVKIGQGCVLADDVVVGAGNRLEHGMAVWPGTTLSSNSISFP